MEELIKVREKGQLTLPLSLRKELGIEIGSMVMARMIDNAIVLVPQKVVDRDQSWFWKEKWQKLEAEADRDISEGRTTMFDSVEDLFNDIEGTAQAGSDRKVQKKRP